MGYHSNDSISLVFKVNNLFNMKEHFELLCSHYTLMSELERLDYEFYIYEKNINFSKSVKFTNFLLSYYCIILRLYYIFEN